MIWQIINQFHFSKTVFYPLNWQFFFLFFWKSFIFYRSVFPSRISYFADLFVSCGLVRKRNADFKSLPYCYGTGSCPLVKGESHLLYRRIILMNFDFYEGILSKILYKCLISDLGNSPLLRGQGGFFVKLQKNQPSAAADNQFNLVFLHSL